MNNRMLAVVAAAWLVLAGCASRRHGGHGNIVTWWGRHTLNDDLELTVSSVGLSSMRYELARAPTQRVLLRDAGRATKGWFFVLDERRRLWIYWSEDNIAVWVPVSGTYQKHFVGRGSPFLLDMAEDFWNRLPDPSKRYLGLAPSDE